MAVEDEVPLWRYLSGEAEEGRLYLDESVAKSCRDACNEQIGIYEDLLKDLQIMSAVSGFGRFDCSDELAKMFGQKAISGDGDVHTALIEHIEVLGLIRDTIQISVERYEAQQQAAAAGQDKLLN
ncbi:hypothetical protein [Nocardia noduli]|uniref:hypothetical protein n=1 Tax=Nocardia noduli TaxID=2815722 RepID=UPI001C22441E|nr:hypothetical protein [Nocardia noduli]